MIRRIQILCTLLAVAASPGAAQTTPAATAPSAPSLDAAGAFFGLSVSDLDATVRWYTEKLGLRVVMRAPARDGVSVVVLEGSGLVVELLHHEGSREAPVRSRSDFRVPGAFKVGVIVRDFDGALAFLRAREVPFAMGPFPERADQPPNVLIRDNEGNLIQILGRRRAP